MLSGSLTFTHQITIYLVLPGIIVIIMSAVYPWELAVHVRSLNHFLVQCILEFKYKAAGMSHIIDDFFFVGPPKSNKCLQDLNAFLTLCQKNWNTNKR